MASHSPQAQEHTRIQGPQPDLPARYIDIRTLGKGAVGQVYRAKDRLLGQEVAIKVTQEKVTKRAQFRRLFAREIRLNAQLAHPYIVPLLDAGITPSGQPFLVMSLADGGSFAQFRRFPPVWPELLRLTQEVLEALGYLHAQGVLHRDLKPENILLHRGEDGKLHAWLADLGAANMAEDMPKEQEIGGTPMYIGPEHATGDLGQLDKASDLYALSAMLKEFLTGRPPFQAKSIEELVAQKEEEPRPFAAKAGYDLPPKVVDILCRQMAPDPLERYDLAADFSNALEAATPKAKRASKAPPQSPGSRRVMERQTLLQVDTTYGAAHEPTAGAQRPAEGVPRWLKPNPKVMPKIVPLMRRQPDGGRSSLALFSYRKPALVGRDGHLQFLWDRARHVITSGAPQVLLLRGPAGVGKSHLVQTLATRLEEGGWMERLELRYHNPPGPTDGLKGALIRLIRPEAGSRLPIHKRMQRRLARWRGQRSDKEKRDASLLARQTKGKGKGRKRGKIGETRWFLYEYLEAHSWRGGSLLIIENAHNAKDDDGLAYAEALLRSQGTLAIPALVIATIRSENLENDMKLKRRCDALISQGALWVDIGPMGEEAIQGVLSEYLTLEPHFLKELARRCEGNPLFAQQLLDAWIEHKRLVDRGGLRYGLKPGMTIDEALPSSTEALLLDRIEALIARKARPQEMRQALHLAALAGHEGPIALLHLVMGRAWAQEVLSATGIIIGDDAFYSFQHGLLRETLVRQAENRSDLQHLHLILARGWLDLEGQSQEGTGLKVAHHLLLANKPLDALNRALSVAQVAMHSAQSGRCEEASKMASRAAEMAKLSRHDSRRVAGQRYLAMSYQLQGQVQRAASMHLDLMLRAREHHAFRLEEVHLLDLGRAQITEGNLAEALKHLRYAQDMAQARGDGVAQARSQRAIAEIHRRRGAQEEATHLLEDSLALAEAAEAIDEQAHCLKELVRCRLLPGQDLRREEGMILKALALAEKGEDDRLVGQCQLTWAEIVKMRGDLSTARMRYARCFRFFAQRQLAESAIQCLLNLALIDLTLGRPNGAKVFIADAYRWMADNQEHWLRPIAGLYEANALTQEGELAQAEKVFFRSYRLGLGKAVDHDLTAPLEQLASLAQQKGNSKLAIASTKMAAHVWQKLGDLDEVRRLQGQLQRLQSPPV